MATTAVTPATIAAYTRDSTLLPPLTETSSILRISNLHHVKLDQLLVSTSPVERVSRDETLRHRWPKRQYILVHLLADGFSNSYGELFNLEKSYIEHERSVGRKNTLPPEELQLIADSLMRAEIAERLNELEVLYSILKSLAEQFSQKQLISHHFLQRAYSVGQQIGTTDESRTLADANRTIGLAYFTSEQYSDAEKHLSDYISIIENATWQTSPSFDYLLDACDLMRQLYIKLGELSSNSFDSLEYYQRAHTYAVRCGNPGQMKEVSHKLATIHEKLNDFDLCAEHLNNVLKISQSTQTYEIIGSAAEIFGRVYEQIKLHETVPESLEVFRGYLGFAPNTDEGYGAVCSCLGAVCTSDNELQKAQEFLGLSYSSAIAKHGPDKCPTRKDKEALDESKIQVSIASSHQMLGLFAAAVEAGHKGALQTICAWKNHRDNGFKQ